MLATPTSTNSLKFSRARYEKYDAYAKEVGKSLLIQMGYTVTDEREGYKSHDFIVELGGKAFKVEVEQKNGWEFRQFPFRTHRVSHRKYTSQADLFLQVSKNGKYIAMCPMASVLRSPVVLRDTCFGTKDEPFFDVPTSAMRYYESDESIWYEAE